MNGGAAATLDIRRAICYAGKQANDGFLRHSTPSHFDLRRFGLYTISETDPIKEGRVSYMIHVDLLDPEKDYLIIAPINEQGVDELYCNDIFKDSYISRNLQYMVFHEDMYNYMESRLFDIINVELGTLINMYEEEIVDNEKLMQLLSVVDMLIRNSDDEKSLTFMENVRNLIQIAIDKKTVVGFCF